MNKRIIKSLIVIFIVMLFINISNVYAAIDLNKVIICDPIGYNGSIINISNLQISVMFIALIILLIINNIKDKNTIRTVIISIITLGLSIFSYIRIQAFGVSDVWYGTYISKRNGLIIYAITILILLINISMNFIKTKKKINNPERRN